MINPDSETDTESRLLDLPGALDNNEWLFSDIGAREVQRLLASVQHQLALFDIKTPSGSAESTAVRRAALAEQVQLYRTAIAPLRKLPNEILAEIFFFAAGEVTVPSSNLDVEPPWTLFSVCKRWRQVALATPTLWSCVRLYYASRMGEDEWWVEIVRTVLAKSEGRGVLVQTTTEQSQDGSVLSSNTQRTLLHRVLECIFSNALRYHAIRTGVV